MIIYSTKFKDLKILKFKKNEDLRGNLVKVYDKRNKLLKFDCYESYLSSSKKGTVRGLHGQSGKFSQSKIIYCVKGKVLDLAVDLRKNSRTYCQTFKKIISSKNLLGILIPKGFAHGVIILEKNTILLNLNSSKYDPRKEFGINIKSLNIKLPKLKLIFSRKDKNLQNLNEFLKFKK